jgi:hypothetical protein
MVLNENNLKNRQGRRVNGGHLRGIHDKKGKRKIIAKV